VIAWCVVLVARLGWSGLVAYLGESVTFVRRVLRLVLAVLAFFGHGR
jgi:hypothetical protein